MGETELLVSLW